MALIGLTITIFAQVWNVKNFNEGAEIALKKKSQELNLLSSINLNLIRTAYDEIREIHELNDDLPIIAKLKEQNIDLSVFTGQIPIFWTSNAFNIKPQYYKYARIEDHLGDYMVIKPYKYKYREFIFTYKPLKNPEFSFFGNQVSSIEKTNKFSLKGNPIENSITTDIAGLPLFYLSIDSYFSPLYWSIIFLLGVLIFFVAIYRLLSEQGHPRLAVLSISILLIYIEVLLYKNHILWNLKSLNLFAPEIFASNGFAPSLGVLFFNSLLFFILLLYTNFQVSNLKIKSSPEFRFRLWLLLLVLYAAFCPVLYTYMSKLVRDSSLSFDFYEIFLFNIYTVIALIIIFLGFLSLYSLLSLLTVHHLVDAKTKKTKVIVTLVIVIIFAITWWSTNVFLAIVSALTTALFYFLEQNSNLSPNMRLLSRAAIPCVFASIVFHQITDEKDLAHRDTIGAKILLQNEKEPTIKLGKIEVDLSKDLGVIDYYVCKDESKVDFESRIRQVYFSAFSDNYETSILDFDKRQNDFLEKNAYDYYDIDTLFNSRTCKPVSSHFTLVTQGKLKGSFLGKFEAFSDSAFYGTYYILMKPKNDNAVGKLSQIFERSPMDALFNQNQYSYAIYSQGKLSRRYGSYKYITEIEPSKTNFYTKGDYTHYVYSDDLNNKIVISKPQRSWIQNISSFTLLALCTVITFIIYYLIILARQALFKYRPTYNRRMRFMAFLKRRYRMPFWNKLYLSNKLQLYVVGVVFVTFLAILITTVQYFNNSYKSRQIKFLWDKSTDIANNLSTQTNIQAIFNQNDNGILYELSKYYNTDINLFEPNGKLIFSSNDKIYEQDLIGKIMRPDVYKKLTIGKQSGIINNEKLGNLNYIASYLSIFDNNLKLKGYINLPYFTNEQDLIREISNYSATLINLFALVFALTAILAYLIGQRIIRPLNTIRKEFGSVKLGKEYSPILYKNNDEIGLLINEYNKMLLELEASTNKLAESERQGAWREMAKQVAHEIKNPLTPMKLSLQHLQLVIQQGGDQMKERANKTANLIISQIESLAAMAEEFSSFAKMPEAQTEITDICQELSDACHLFNTEDKVKITKDIPNTSVFVNVDQQQIGRVFNNILKNAIQSIPEDRIGEIHCQIELKNDQVLIRIKDNGSGIPEELYPRIFSPNFSTKNSGMGLGLAMSKKIIEQFQGTISFKSETNVGTEFIIRLPFQS